MSPTPRGVARVITPEPVIEGAGVHLRRSIGTRAIDYLDPFLLLDHFESVTPSDYEAGFPFHPHRGIETVTLIRKGEVRHGDSLGHRGTIGAGDIQWMTSGSGILHEEMPQVRTEGIAGLQLWLNACSSRTGRSERPARQAARPRRAGSGRRRDPPTPRPGRPRRTRPGPARAPGRASRAEIEQTLEDLRTGRFIRDEPRDA